ncbi:tyrosine-type recombinase/integrase [uncultured Corynebacterium sp.]|uniref:tyrosine-type recombinase/integrase n=1 Tax=uncultured Corynebacterium sp. TaxID=159447 RepID=UPI002612C6EA|nr:tyrosine-type recombinase/integrase [uncultured Corynebacterium sp.]
MRSVKNLQLGSIYKTKRGDWRAAITIGYDGQGRQVRRTTSGKTKAECLRRRNDLYLQLQQKTTTPTKVTVETFIHQWIDTAALEKYSPNSLRNVKGHCRNYIIPTLGKYQIKDVGADEVRELDQAVRNAGCSDRTVQIVHSTFSAAMRDAVRRGLIEVNPVSRVDRPRAVSRPRTALTVDQARHLIMHSVTTGDSLASLWAAYLFLGPRKGELLGLTRDRVCLVEGAAQIDLSWALSSVPWRHGRGCKCSDGVRADKCGSREHAVPPGYEWRELSGSMILSRPKTLTSRRIVPVPAPLDVVLRQHVEESPRNEWNLVWLSETGKPIRPERVLKRWKAALRDAGLPIVDLHTARHTAASLLRECGVGPEVIAAILGHAKVDTTFNYVHVNAGQTKRALADYSAFLGLPGGDI